MYGSRFIVGINPSIAKLVHALMCWGVETVSSHASFYPGDEEEQEYWIQKSGVEEEIGIRISGPIVLACSVHDFPYVWIRPTTPQINKLKELLTEGWSLKKEQRLFHRKQQEMFNLEYSSERFQAFKRAIDSFWDPWLEKYPEEEWDIFLKQANIDEINARFHQSMPLSSEEYTKERDTAINKLAKALYHDIPNQDGYEIKKRIERHLIAMDELYE